MENIKTVTSVNLTNMPEGLRLTFTYSEVTPEGNVVDSNKRGSFVVLDDETKKTAQSLFELAKSRIR